MQKPYVLHNLNRHRSEWRVRGRSNKVCPSFGVTAWCCCSCSCCGRSLGPATYRKAYVRRRSGQAVRKKHGIFRETPPIWVMECRPPSNQSLRAIAQMNDERFIITRFCSMKHVCTTSTTQHHLIVARSFADWWYYAWAASSIQVLVFISAQNYVWVFLSVGYYKPIKRH